MKKIITAFVLFFVLATVSYSMDIGGFQTVGVNKWKLTGGLDFVNNKDAHWANGLTPLNPGEQLTTGFSIAQAMARVSYGVLNNLDVYAKAGTANIYGSARKLSSGVLQYRDQINAWSVPTYGFGVKVNSKWNNWLIGGDAQYSNFNEHSFDAQRYNPAGAVISTTSGKLAAYEWHVAAMAAINMGTFTPYGGLRYSDFYFKRMDAAWDEQVAAANLGAFFGTEYMISDKLSCNMEIGLIDETDFSVMFNYKI
ncbi:MAG: hypothetical protein NT099_07985 [Candidatus Saganbacteria bacterium]|nr:hypothetical protein [Candidatus Saganbacteria bacterium]